MGRGAAFFTVLNDQQRSRGPRDMAQRRQHSCRGGGCEDVATHRCREHARAHEPRVRRLVPRSAACAQMPATVACLPLSISRAGGGPWVLRRAICCSSDIQTSRHIRQRYHGLYFMSNQVDRTGLLLASLRHKRYMV